MKTLLAALMLAGLALSSRAAKSETKEPFKLIHVEDLAAELKSPKPPLVLDANNQDTRDKFGVVPGAVLLPNYKKWDAAKTLPADKTRPLVFYCANTQCMASHMAAERAAKAGYGDVSVMSDGIAGWAKAGRPVEHPGKN